MENLNYIGISEDRMMHIIGVARKCYKISKEMGYEEEFCRKMFMIGYLHDMGYEFSTKKEDHPFVSNELCKFINFDSFAIVNHGKEVDNPTIEWIILNKADMQVDSKGKEVSVYERLKDIEIRYGIDSEDYQLAKKIAYLVGLIN